MTDVDREIKRLISYIRSCREANIDCTVTIDKSLTHGVLNALEKIRQYRAIGTVEECREAVEKQKPKSPKDELKINPVIDCNGAYSVTEPLDTIPTHDRFGLVTIQGVDYQIVDIGLRMLEPRELYGCQGFPDDYIIDHDYSGKSYPRSEQVKRCGNAVCPPIPAAMVRANLPELCVTERTGNIKISQEQTGQLKFA